MERVTGVEPASAAWEAAVLPMNYTRKHEDHTAQTLFNHIRAWLSVTTCLDVATLFAHCHVLVLRHSLELQHPILLPAFFLRVSE